jgi:7-carboxy-7-deazaguanine synthase
MLNIYSVFNSIDGEINAYNGIGEPTTFIRLKGCNLSCEFCDTKYANEGSGGIGEISVQTFIELYKNTFLPKITITGGEPLLQRDDLWNLIDALIKKRVVSIETNGTLPLFSQNECDILAKTSKYARYIMDYKLIPSKVPFCKDNFYWLRPWDVLKFVVRNFEDYEKARQIIFENEPNCLIAFSPIFQSNFDLCLLNDTSIDSVVCSEKISYNLTFARQLAEKVVEDCNKSINDYLPRTMFSLQLHKLLWPMADSINEH